MDPAAAGEKEKIPSADKTGKIVRQGGRQAGSGRFPEAIERKNVRDDADMQAVPEIRSRRSEV
jgi:hypothetical protein